MPCEVFHKNSCLHCGDMLYKKPFRLKKVKIIPVESIEEVLKNALDWSGKKRIKEMIFNNGKGKALKTNPKSKR